MLIQFDYKNILMQATIQELLSKIKETKISADIQGKSMRFGRCWKLCFKGQTLIQLDNSLLKLQLQTVEVQILEDDVKRYTILTGN